MERDSERNGGQKRQSEGRKETRWKKIRCEGRVRVRVMIRQVNV